MFFKNTTQHLGSGGWRRVLDATATDTSGGSILHKVPPPKMVQIKRGVENWKRQRSPIIFGYCFFLKNFGNSKKLDLSFGVGSFIQTFRHQSRFYISSVLRLWQHRF
jgi:hypothetical protein